MAWLQCVYNALVRMVLRQLANILGLCKWHSSFATWEISDELYGWIRTNVPDGSTILELGSGAGTSRLVEHYGVHSVEHDAAWVGKEPRSTYIHAPIRDYGTYRWYDADILKNALPKEYDALLVDGPPGFIGRMGVVEQWHLFSCRVPVIIDDCDRPAEFALLQALAAATKRQYRIYETSQLNNGQVKKFAVLE